MRQLSYLFTQEQGIACAVKGAACCPTAAALLAVTFKLMAMPCHLATLMTACCKDGNPMSL